MSLERSHRVNGKNRRKSGGSGSGSAEEELMATLRQTSRTRAEHTAGEESSWSSFVRDPDHQKTYLDGLMEKVAKRERRLGRYNPITSLAYASLGTAYHKKQEPRAVAMYRSAYRIEAILYGSKINGPIGGAFLRVLQERQLSDADIECIQRDVNLSTHHELEGDWCRRYGRRQQALMEYHLAARIEESSFGRDNPDLTFLWRKMACLSAIKRGLHNHADVDLLLDFEKADRIGNDWMKGSRKFLSSSICSMIRRGDEYFSMLLYTHAVGEYFKASSGALAAISHNIEKSATKARANDANLDGPSDTPTTQQSTEEFHEQQQLPQNGSTMEHDDATQQTQETHLEWTEFAGGASAAPVVESTQPKEPETYPTWRSLLSTRTLIVSNQHGGTSSNPGSNTSLLQDNPAENLGDLTNTHNFDPEINKPKQDTIRPAKSESSLMTSLRRGSTMSLMGHHGLDDPSPRPIRPKSDSYLSRIRRKTKKMTRKSLKKIKALTGEQSSIVDEKSATVKFAVAVKPALSDPPATGTVKVDNGARTRSASPYRMMPSPPMTPFHSTVKQYTAGHEEDGSLPSISVFDL